MFKIAKGGLGFCCVTCLDNAGTQTTRCW